MGRSSRVSCLSLASGYATDAPTSHPTPTPTALQDKTPSPLTELDTLMGETYDQLLGLADMQEAAQAAARDAAQALGGGLQLLLQLARCAEGVHAGFLSARTPPCNACMDGSRAVVPVSNVC